jgi:hypothetical protein
MPLNYILIYGRAGSGKTIFAHALGRAMGPEWQVAETSDRVVVELARLLAHSTHTFVAPVVGHQAMVSWVHENKRQCRGDLAAVGELMTSIQADVLVQDASTRGRIIVGPRRIREVVEWCQRCQRMGDRTQLICVDRPGHESPADGYELESLGHERIIRVTNAASSADAWEDLADRLAQGWAPGLLERHGHGGAA